MTRLPYENSATEPYSDEEIERSQRRLAALLGENYNLDHARRGSITLAQLKQELGLGPKDPPDQAPLPFGDPPVDRPSDTEDEDDWDDGNLDDPEDD